MKVETVDIDFVMFDPANVRKHGERNLETIKASLARFGQQKPVVVGRGNVVLAGNGTLAAARALGWDEIKIVRTDLTGTDATAYAIADNRSAELAEWDDQSLAETLRALQSEDFDLDAVGYTDAEVDALIDGLGDSLLEGDGAEEDGGGQVDRADELQAKWKTATGQLWVIPSVTGKGDHRLLCGDSTKAEDVARVMGGKKADLCFTSPPYGQQRDYTKEIGDWDALMRGVFAALPMADAGQVLVNLGLIHRDGEWIPYWDGWIEWMRQQGWRRFGWYVWDQGFGLPGDWNGRLGPSHEFVFHFNRKSVRPEKFVDKQPENVKELKPGEASMRRKDGKCVGFSNLTASLQPTKIPDSVIRITRMQGGHGIDHPALFPVGLPVFAMSAWPGVLFEPFCGSGTTIVAAEQLGRLCHAIELAPKYVAVILERLADMGLEPYLDSTVENGA